MYQPKIRILKDSLNIYTKDRLTTFEISNFPKCLLAQLNTHRVFSRNAASSRAIPVSKIIEKIQSDPYIPSFTGNQKGMVGIPLNRKVEEEAVVIYLNARNLAIAEAKKLLELNVHKENINRILEPWMTVPVLVSSTTWFNFFQLRCTHDSSPDISKIAWEMKNLLDESTPTPLDISQMHICYDSYLESCVEDDKPLVVGARCARISYCNHGKNTVDIDLDLDLAKRLIAEKHLSPFEHIAWPVLNSDSKNCRNYSGFYSYRAFLEDNKFKIY